MSNPNPNERIVTVLMDAFKSKCKRPLDRGASEALDKFIAVTVIKAVDMGTVEFEQQEDYLLDNFRGIGATLQAANPGTPVSRDEMIRACEKQVNTGQEKLARARERARERNDNERLEALAREGRVCESFTRADLE